MNVNDVFRAGQSLKVDDLKGKAVVLHMGNTKAANFDDGTKIELEFQGTDRTMILNKTNAFHIAQLYGEDTDRWFGQKIELYPDTTLFGGRMVPCIRVRAPQGQPTPQQAVMETQAPINQSVGGATPGGQTPGDLDDEIPF